VTLTLRIWVLKLASWLFALLPVRERVVLASTHSEKLQGNLAFIHAELMRRGLSGRVVCLLHSPSVGFAGKAAMLAYGIRAEFFLATSRVFIVDDYFFPLYVAHKKSETTVIQVWHAAGAFKKVGYSTLGKSFGATESLVRRVAIHSNYDYCLAASTMSVPAYSEAFHQPAERFVTDIGIPRTDLFFDETRVNAAPRSVREHFGIPADKRIALYAPTFRGDSRFEAAYHDSLDLERMKEACGDTWVLLVRLHPFVRQGAPIPHQLADFAIDASDHPDINELMLASDVLITDYSSAIFEFALLERPMIFFAPDHEAYEAERGFYFDYRTGVPGPVLSSTDEVARALVEDRFDLDRVAAFRRNAFDVADGHASERFVTELVIPNLG
jgi:CDP-ribitol ribitolphosphotransferase